MTPSHNYGTTRNIPNPKTGHPRRLILLQQQRRPHRMNTHCPKGTWPQGDMVQPPKSPTSMSSEEQVIGSILPPLFEDREDLEEVDHCLVSDLPEAASLFAEASSVSAGDPVLGSTSFSPGVSLTPCCSGSFSLQNWAIFWASISWASFSSCRMSSMVSPYHSSCQHQACRWARTMTFRRPAKPKRPCHHSHKLQEPTCSPPKTSQHHGRDITVTSSPQCCSEGPSHRVANWLLSVLYLLNCS